MDDLEILPYGRTRAQQEALDRRKASGRRGWHGCLVQALAVALVLVWLAGYMAGKNS